MLCVNNATKGRFVLVDPVDAEKWPKVMRRVTTTASGRVIADEELKTEIKESGQVTVALGDVRDSIGKDRQQWQVAWESELQSLRDIGAIQTVAHVPHGKQILPMKVVLTLKNGEKIELNFLQLMYAHLYQK